MHVYLHIGSEKTGTTSIQRLFATCRDSLRERGLLYPSAAAAPWGHHGIAAHACATSTTAWNLPPAAGDDGTPNAVASALHAEVAATACDRVVLSSEMLSSRLRTAEQVACVRDLLAPFARRTTVLLYVRNPVRIAESQFAMTVAAGNTAPFPYPIPETNRWALDQYGVACLWAAVFGREQVQVRHYRSSRHPTRSAVDDFAGAVGLDAQRDLPPPEHRVHANPSLQRDALAYLRGLHLLPAAERPRADELRQLKLALRGFAGGGPYRLPRDLAVQILSDLRPGNDALVREFLAGEPGALLTLADGHRPAALDSLELTAEVAARAGLHCWRSRRIQERQWPGA